MNPIVEQNVVLFIEHSIIDITQVTKLNNTLKQMQHSSDQKLVSKREPVYDHTPKNIWNCDINRKRGIRSTKNYCGKLKATNGLIRTNIQTSTKTLRFKIKNGLSPMQFLILEFSGQRLQVQDGLSPMRFLIFLVFSRVENFHFFTKNTKNGL